MHQSNLTRSLFRFVSTLMMLLALSSLVGCQWTPKSADWRWPWQKKEKELAVPDKMMPIWTDTILHQPGKPGVRGFGGRIFFYLEDKTDPVEVDGGFVVYVFDSDNFDPGMPQPEKKYVFTPEQFKEHLSDSNMGPSYSVWIPWDQVGGPNQRLTIVGRFEGRNGGTLISDPTIKLLPGISRSKTDPVNSPDSDSNHQGPMQTASFSKSHQNPPPSIQDVTAPNTPPSRRTETIDIPPSFQRHMQLQRKFAPNEADSDPRRSSTNTPSPYPDPSTPSNQFNTSGSPNTIGSASTVGSLNPLASPLQRAAPPTNHPVQAASYSNSDETTVYDARTLPPSRRTGLGYNSRFRAAGTPGAKLAMLKQSEDPIVPLSDDEPEPLSPNDMNAIGIRTPNTPARMFRDRPVIGGWIESLPRTPRSVATQN